jgi:hypothetical protein
MIHIQQCSAMMENIEEPCEISFEVLEHMHMASLLELVEHTSMLAVAVAVGGRVEETLEEVVEGRQEVAEAAGHPVVVVVVPLMHLSML